MMYKKALNNRGEILSVEDAKDGLEGLVLTRDGVYYWQDGQITKKILKELDDEITEEELNKIKGEYSRVSSLEKFFYDWFIENEFEEDIMKIIHKDFIDEEMLHIQYKIVTNLIWTYNCFIRLNHKGEVQVEKDIVVDQDEHDKRFGMGKHEKTVDDLEAYEREKYGNKKK